MAKRWSVRLFLCAVLLGLLAALTPACSPPTPEVELPSPDVTIIANPPDRKIEVGETVALTVKEAEGTNLRFEWSVSRGQLSRATGCSVFYTAPQTSGPDTVTVEVSSDNGMATGSVDFIVVLPPTATVTLTTVPSPTATLTPLLSPTATLTPLPSPTATLTPPTLPTATPTTVPVFTPATTAILTPTAQTGTLVLKPLKEGEELKYKIYLTEPGGQETELQELVDTEQHRVAPGKYELQLASSCYYNVPRQEVDIQAQAITEVDFSPVVGWLSFLPPESTTEQRYQLYTDAGDRLSSDGCTPTVGLGPGAYRVYPYYPYIGVRTEVVVTSGEETPLDWEQFNQEEVGTLAFKVSETTGEPRFYIYNASGDQMSSRTGSGSSSSSTRESFSALEQYWLMPGTYQKIEFQSPYLGVTVENFQINAGEEKVIDLEQIAGSLTLRLPEDATSLDFSVFKTGDSENELAHVSYGGETGSRYWLAPGTYNIRFNNIYIGLVTEVTIQAGQDTVLDLPELSTDDLALLTLKPLEEGTELKYKIYLAEPSDQVTALQTLVDTKQYRVAPGKYELQLASSCYYNVPRQEVDIQAQATTEVDFSSVVGWLSFSSAEDTTEQKYRLYTGAGDRLSSDDCTPPPWDWGQGCTRFTRTIHTSV